MMGSEVGMRMNGERRDSWGWRFGWMRVVVAMVCVALGGWIADAAYAQDAPAPVVNSPDQVVVPDTPVGEHLGWFLQAIAQTNPPSGDEVERRFSPEFLEQIPTNAVISLVKTVRMQLGTVALESIDERSPNELVATLFSKKVEQPFALSLATKAEAPHQIYGLNIRPLPKRPVEGDTWDDIDTELEEVASRVSIGAYRVRENGSLQPIHMLNEREPLAMGSAFKLWVLAALADEVKAGRLKFDDTLAVRDEWKSLPGGTMQNEPAGTEHPLSHFAERMITISDNTATDHLIHLIGRENVERAMSRWCAEPERNIPFLTTRDMFVLKLDTDPALADRYIAGDVDEKRSILDDEVAQKTPNLAAASFWIAPRRIDTLEWFASAEELCRTISDLAALGSSDESMAPVIAAMSVNPGVPLDRDRWLGFAYKGGSEPGVLNLTIWLLRDDGERFALSMFANDSNRMFEQGPVIALFERAIGMLARE